MREEDEADGSLWTEWEASVSSKRLRGENGWVLAGGCTAVADAGDSSNSLLGAETRLDSSRNGGGKLQTVAKVEEQKVANVSFEASESCWENASVPHCGDLDDILDVLLQKLEPVSSEPLSTVLQSFGPPHISSNVTESNQESSGIAINGASAQFSNSVQHPDKRDLSFASTTSSSQKGEVSIEREHPGAVYDRMPRRQSWDWQAPTCEQPATASVHSHPFPNGLDSNHSLREERSLKSSTSDLLQQSQRMPLFCKGERVHIWAGPTLLEIESALAHKDSASPLMYSPAPINSIGSSSPSLSLSECLDGEGPRANGASGVREDGARSGETPWTEDKKFKSWSMLLKRGAGERKYTLRLRCEEEAVSDGYRWRKYGQKTIKSSPHPRSYYRCTSSKCTAKKQVERSSEDPRLLLVTYEGIHLHPQPNPLANCMASHLVEENDYLLSNTCSIPPSSSTSAFGALLPTCTSPLPSCTPQQSSSSSPC